MAAKEGNMPFSPSTHSSLISLDMLRKSPKSRSVQQTLRQLKKDEHDIRVAKLLKKNETFYRRQKVCESFTTFSILVSFSGKSS